MKNEELLNYAIDNIDQKFVDETAEALYKRTGKERPLYEIKVTKSPAPKKKSYKWAVGIAASVAVVAGIGVTAAVLPKAEWGRPSAASEGIEITLPVTEKPVIETDPVAYETDQEVFEEPIPEDEISEVGLEYHVPPGNINGEWIGGSGGDYMYAFNDNPGSDLIAFNTFTGEIKYGNFSDLGDTGTSVNVGNYRDGVYLYVNATKTITIYDEVLNPIVEAAFPDESSTFIPQWDGKYVWTFKDENESLKRNDKSCILDLYARSDDSGLAFYKSVTLPQYICGAWYVNYDENKDEIAFFGQKFTKGTDISEGFKSVFCIINAETGNVTFEREYDGYYFRKASFNGGLIITLMRKNADEVYNAHPILLYYDGTELEINSLIGSVSGISVSPNGKYLAVQINDSNPGEDKTIRIYEIENRKIVNSDSPAEIKYNSPEEGVGGFVGNNGLYYNNQNGMLNVLVPPEKEDRDFSAETAGIIEAIKKYTESDIPPETVDTIEEHKAYLAEMEDEKADAEAHKAKLEAENEEATGNNPEKIVAYEEEIRILEKNIAAIDVKIEEAKERIKKFEATIAELEEKAKEASGVSDEEETTADISLFFPLDQKEWIITTFYSEVDPWTGGVGLKAIDYSGETVKGADVYAEIAGTVRIEDREDYYNVYITDENGSETMITNLYEIYVKDGDVVNKGDPIGAAITNSIMNANVYAAISGTVIESDDNVNMPPYDKGKYIVIEDDNGVQTLYSHLSAVYVKTGDKIEKGDVIGSVGSTGFSTGPHLHFEVTVNGNPIDPTLYYEN